MLNTEETSAKATSVNALVAANDQRRSVLVVGVVNTAMEGQLRTAVAALVASVPDEKFMPRIAVSKVYDAGVTGPNGAPVKYRAFIMSVWANAPIVSRRSALGSIPNHEVIKEESNSMSPDFIPLKTIVDREIGAIEKLAGGFDETFA